MFRKRIREQLEKLGEVSVKLSDEAMTQKKLMFRKVDSSFRDLVYLRLKNRVTGLVKIHPFHFILPTN